MADLGDEVADALVDRDPEHADAYRDNAADLRVDLRELDQSYAEGLANCERSTVVVSHDAFGYLDRYGLEFAPISGLSPGAEPTPADLSRLQDLIRAEGITTVFSERLVSPRMSETLADDLGIRTAVLDPIEGLSDETQDEDYLSLMRANLTALQEANGCR
jgi:zinc transport system substrate-binding protein